MRFPDEFCNRMKALLGGGYDAFIASYSEPEPGRGLRINTLKCKDPAALAAELCVKDGVEWCGAGYYAPDGIGGSHPYHAAGLF